MIAFDRCGAGPPLVLLHPLGADRQVWEPILDHIAPHREVLTVDLPGFGDSPPLERIPTPSALAQAVAAFLKSQDLVRPHVVGNSLGGWVALELALAGQTRSATAIAPAGLWTKPLLPKRGIARRLARAALPLVDPLTASAAGRRLLLRGAVAFPERVPARAAAHLVRAYATAPGFKATNDAMRSSRFSALERIRVPVTLLWAEHDRLVRPPAWLPPAVKTRVLQGAGHIPMWDVPEKLARVLIESTRV